MRRLEIIRDAKDSLPLSLMFEVALSTDNSKKRQIINDEIKKNSNLFELNLLLYVLFVIFVYPFIPSTRRKQSKMIESSSTVCPSNRHIISCFTKRKTSSLCLLTNRREKKKTQRYA